MKGPCWNILNLSCCNKSLPKLEIEGLLIPWPLTQKSRCLLLWSATFVKVLCWKLFKTCHNKSDGWWQTAIMIPVEFLIFCKGGTIHRPTDLEHTLIRHMYLHITENHNIVTKCISRLDNTSAKYNHKKINKK